MPFKIKRFIREDRLPRGAAVPKAGLRQRQRIVEAESIRLHDVEACALSNVERSPELPHHQSGFLGSQVDRDNYDR